MGLYVKLNQTTQGNRPVYKRVGSTMLYLFYWPEFSSWRIGADYTVGSCSVSTPSTEALCPEQATDYAAWTGSAWTFTPVITVGQSMCAPAAQGACLENGLLDNDCCALRGTGSCASGFQGGQTESVCYDGGSFKAYSVRRRWTCANSSRIPPFNAACNRCAVKRPLLPTVRTAPVPMRRNL
jgi:hypothetical protein